MRLRDARVRRLWTQQRLAQLAGVGRATIAKIESGNDVALAFRTIERLSRALEVEPSEIDEFRQTLGLQTDGGPRPE